MTGETHPLDFRITRVAGALVFAVRVQPRANRDEVAGTMDGAIKIRLRAPALENRANDALIELLADRLGMPKAAVRILSGDRSRIKRVEVRGVTEKQILSLLAGVNLRSTK
jgi:uncharacterized protein (TIGR00251 family)